MRRPFRAGDPAESARTGRQRHRTRRGCDLPLPHPPAGAAKDAPEHPSGQTHWGLVQRAVLVAAEEAVVMRDETVCATAQAHDLPDRRRLADLGLEDQLPVRGVAAVLAFDDAVAAAVPE